MSPPVKKRIIAIDDVDDSSACPSFESPTSLKCGKVKDDGDYDRSERARGVIGSTFQVQRSNNSQDDSASLLDSPMGLATQPPLTEGFPTTVAKRTPQTKENPAKKKRKVSLSPKDSLARQPQQRTSPQERSSSQNDGMTAMYVEDLPRSKRNLGTSMSISSESKTPRVVKPDSVHDAPFLASATVPDQELTTAPISTAEKTSLKTTLFPGSLASGIPTTKAQESSKAGTMNDDFKLSSNKASATSSSKTNSKGINNAAKTTTTCLSGAKSISAEEPQVKRNKQKSSIPKGEQTDLSKSSGKGSKPAVLSTDASKSEGAPLVMQSVAEKNKGISSEEGKAVEVEHSVNKTKKKKQSFQDQLLQLISMSCRPFTVKLLAQELKTNESSVNFCMLSLVDKGWIMKKEFTTKSGARSKELFWANYEAKAKELKDALNDVTPQEIENAIYELKLLQSQHASIVNDTMQVQRAISNEELNAQLQAFEAEVTTLEKRLRETHARIQAARQGSGSAKGRMGRAGTTMGRPQPAAKPVSIKRLKTQINDMRLHWKQRKEKCMDFVEQLADGMEKKVKDVVKLLELVTDEMEGVKLPPKHESV